MNLTQYIETVNKRYKSGISREHSYRGDFENLFRELIKNVEITNEPANVTDCGNPDYVITKRKIPIGYIEAKDIGKDLNSKSYKEQFGRYKKALDNLIITDYIWFQFFQGGNLVHEIRIAEIDNGIIKPIPENFAKFKNLIIDFAAFIGQTIKSSKKLAEMMAAKARLLQDILERAVSSDEETHENTSIQSQYSTFKQILIHDLTPKAFADIYAQTLAYGMFAARLRDKTLNDFDRQEAAELIPKTNPFLRKLFGYIAGPDIDERIIPTVNNLANVFRATNVEELLKNFDKETHLEDPTIHFYETFLKEYDPDLRDLRGVYYTPKPVVNFMIRGVDSLLKSDFKIQDGIADTSKVRIKRKVFTKKTADRRSKAKEVEYCEDIHRVQILDPATGTGTFLSEVVKYIYLNKFKSMQGAWNGYVDEHLIPRLNGFELLMASYSMAHLKLDLLLQDCGYKSSNKESQRFKIYLTNSLEESHPDTGNLFSNWLSIEANEANHVKRDTPVMAIIGNPPYQKNSKNKGTWITSLMKDYKKEPGKNEKLNERNPKEVNNDYVKFIRLGQHLIDKNGEGVLAYINLNGFIENSTFRGVRYSLLNSFDKIYVINLHGSSLKSEKSPDGSPDENVFEIIQGVSINIFVKTGEKKKNELADVYNYDLYGKQNFKYDFLNKTELKDIPFKKISLNAPNYVFADTDLNLFKVYEKGFSPIDLFKNYTSGVQTDFDPFSVHDDKNHSENVKVDLQELSVDDVLLKYSLPENKRKKIISAKNDILKNPSKVLDLHYKAFDFRSVIYTGKSNGIIGRPRTKVMQHMINGENLCLILKRGRLLGKKKSFNHCFVSSKLVDKNFLSDQSYCFPLYNYVFEMKSNKYEKISNLNDSIVTVFSQKLELEYLGTIQKSNKSFSDRDVVDYMYGVLHSNNYRNKYKDFLKSDFPKIPYPKDTETFNKIRKKGKELINNHLLDLSTVEGDLATYPKEGTDIVDEKLNWEITDKHGKVWINENQYFDNIPIDVWEFYIGGYQPAKKWIKEKTGKKLSFNDILHFQKIIIALSETNKIMSDIDEIRIE